MTRPRILFVRHGETDWNAEGRLQGQHDIPLNAVGREQADRVGTTLARLVPGIGDLDFVASPLGRTRETMERLRAVIGLAPEAYGLDERLKEITFGSWEGLTWPEVRARDAAAASERERRKWDYVPPGGESYAMLLERVRPAIDALTRETVLVSHGGVARVLLAMLCNVSPRQAAGLDIWQGRVLVIADGHFTWE
ncbi:histidine phosphatase family protein [Salinarimonas soli]|uniref:Histidine phosphatase family protein n=1 Tax=Salinarimonas soli TaxID=1638099 RepID=A0A5B2VTA2_9HYPH|nr:histidine phosphatase family protein [Salinarimonas soli]KAA2242245.1 histidine phosphatase family protein [Salinarimonas soli]